MLLTMNASQLLYGPAAGQNASAPPSDLGTSIAESQFADTRDFVHVLNVRRAAADEDELVVTLRIDPGFHINANPASFEFLLATRLEFVGIAPVRIVYPEPVKFKPKFTDELLDIYEGTVIIHAFFPHGSLSANSALGGAVAAQACTAEVCLPPAVLPFP